MRRRADQCELPRASAMLAAALSGRRYRSVTARLSRRADAAAAAA
jgi:hypothetical protein